MAQKENVLRHPGGDREGIHAPDRLFTPKDMLPIVTTSPTLLQLLHQSGSSFQVAADGSAVAIIMADSQGPWFTYKWRDRRFDGPGWKPTRLTEWPYDQEVDQFPLGVAVEESTYMLDPRAILTEEFSRDESAFITNPFSYLEGCTTAEDFERWFGRAEYLCTHRRVPYPGYFRGQKIPGVRVHVNNAAQAVLSQLGAEYLTAVPTWYHVAKLYEYFGYTYTHEEDGLKMHMIDQALERYSSWTTPQKSWLVMLQFAIERAEFQGYAVPNHLALRDHEKKVLTYPLSPERNLWMHKKIS